MLSQAGESKSVLAEASDIDTAVVMVKLPDERIREGEYHELAWSISPGDMLEARHRALPWRQDLQRKACSPVVGRGWRKSTEALINLRPRPNYSDRHTPLLVAYTPTPMPLNGLTPSKSARRLRR